MANAISANRAELLAIANSVATEKLIDKTIVIEAIEEAIQRAARARFGQENDIRAKLDPMTGDLRLWRVVEVVDVVAQLEQRAAANPQKLNWRTSIVDLLKLLDIDSSLTARKELATELNCPADLMGDSAKMNIWLHKAVLARIAANGGNVPQELLD